MCLPISCNSYAPSKQAFIPVTASGVATASAPRRLRATCYLFVSFSNAVLLCKTTHKNETATGSTSPIGSGRDGVSRLTPCATTRAAASCRWFTAHPAPAGATGGIQFAGPAGLAECYGGPARAGPARGAGCALHKRSGGNASACAGHLLPGPGRQRLADRGYLSDYRTGAGTGKTARGPGRR